MLQTLPKMIGTPYPDIAALVRVAKIEPAATFQIPA
jgi:hypothetical protein